MKTPAFYLVRFLPLLLVFIFVLILYHPVLSVYFSQDDFFHFQVSQTDGSLVGFLNLFTFHPFEERGIAFYRPIFREALFYTFYNFFGLNNLPFRLLSLIIHFINIGLVYTIVQKLFRKRELSLFAAFFFGVTAANVATLYYLAGGIQALGATTFILLSLIFFQKYLEKKEFVFKFFSFLVFLLSLASHELAIVTLPLLLGLVIISGKKLKNVVAMSMRELWPFSIILLLYLYLDFAMIGFSSGERQYQAVFSPKGIINSLIWYSLWALGVPEMLIDFVNPGLSLNPSLMRHWGNFFRIIFPTFFTSLLLLGSALFFLLWRRCKSLLDKRLWFLVFWFMLALVPVVFLPLHKSTYYLAPALPAFWGAIGFLVFTAYDGLQKRQRVLARVFLGSLVASLLGLSVASVRLGDRTYPAAQRGRLAEKLINQVKERYPQLPKSSVFYFKNDPDYPFIAQEWGGSSKQASFILNGDDALQLLYNDSTLKVFYEDLGGIPEDLADGEVFSLVATISER